MGGKCISLTLLLALVCLSYFLSFSFSLLYISNYLRCIYLSPYIYIYPVSLYLHFRFHICTLLTRKLPVAETAAREELLTNHNPFMLAQSDSSGEYLKRDRVGVGVFRREGERETDKKGKVGNSELGREGY